eukprot:8930144-Heterocapsa_arctica.AAC.1
MKANVNFIGWSNDSKINKLAAFMVDKKDERTALSKLGATRRSRNDALRFMHSHEKTQFFYTLMIQCENGSGKYQLGYIMFEDVRNKPYMKALDSMIIDANAMWLNEKNKGDIVECIMALGFIYQHGGSTNKSLEGIMDL